MYQQQQRRVSRRTATAAAVFISGAVIAVFSLTSVSAGALNQADRPNSCPVGVKAGTMYTVNQGKNKGKQQSCDIWGKTSAKGTGAKKATSSKKTTPPVNNASAVKGGVWDRLAHCESTGDWSINSGNGYQGGLQFSPSTWNEFGGKKYASSASQATKAEQIAVATAVQKKQGWNAWPSCSKKIGL